MAVGQRTLRLKRPVHDVAPDEVHRRLLVLGLQVVVECVMRAVRAVVESVPDRLGLRDTRHIGLETGKLGRRTFVCGPPCEEVEFRNTI